MLQHFLGSHGFVERRISSVCSEGFFVTLVSLRGCGVLAYPGFRLSLGYKHIFRSQRFVSRNGGHLSCLALARCPTQRHTCEEAAAGSKKQLSALLHGALGLWLKDNCNILAN